MFRAGCSLMHEDFQQIAIQVSPMLTSFGGLGKSQRFQDAPAEEQLSVPRRRRAGPAGSYYKRPKTSCAFRDKRYAIASHIYSQFAYDSKTWLIERARHIRESSGD